MQEKNKIVEFDEYANSYEKDLNSALEIVKINAQYFTEYKIKYIKNICDKNNIYPKKILDFGCGVGNSSYFLSQYFSHSKIYGIDISKNSIEIAKKRDINNCVFNVYNGEDIFFDENFFDIIFISNVFHHIDHQNHFYLLKKIKELLKENGSLFFFEHNTLNPVTLKIVNDCIFDKDAKLLNFLYTKKLFKKVGFRKIDLKFILFIPPKFKKLLFLENYLQWLPIGGQYCMESKK